MAASASYTTYIQQLLRDMGYRHVPRSEPDARFWDPYHDWMVNTLGPTLTYDSKQLAKLEVHAGGIMDFAYPFMDPSLKLIYVKLTAMVIVIDGAMDDEELCAQIAMFTGRFYRGEPQPNGLLALFQQSCLEVSDMFGDGTILRNMGVLPWINFLDASLMEKEILRDLIKGPREASHVDASGLKFPHYLRSKSGIGEAYAAAILKANPEQNIPLLKFCRAIPDMRFYIDVMNDVLSFHKEELEGETYNLIHLHTRSLSATGARGTGTDGAWTVLDTFKLLCDELRDAAEGCERKMQGEGVTDLDDGDVELAMQWRGFRDGYVSWHLDCSRYKLEAVRMMVHGL
ncbi:terpenoid synthase [Roridomyces roridus]|uniref:Terpenoid synthase n=1 Tax=Roridomyces roridus TaxID=1738132 RepID=A0AAD7B360_9AGAR|nr:terpenoid synthase [Roridomyces roridus]